MWKIAALAGAGLLVGGCSLLAAPSAEVGDCLDIDVNSAQVDTLEGFDCSTEHDVEVYAKSNLSIDGDYDQTAVDAATVEVCRDAFVGYVGVEYEASIYEVFYLFPDADGWETGDREALCFVYPPDTSTGGALRSTGSVKGSNT